MSRTITLEQYASLFPELRDFRDFHFPSGAIHLYTHPVYGPVATVHDGDRIGLVLPDLPSSRDCPGALGHPDDPMTTGGPEWARLVALAGMLATQSFTKSGEKAVAA